MVMTLPASTITTAPITSIATSWHRPWIIAAMAEHGDVHFSNGDRYQDAYAVATHGDRLLLVVADGMSRSPLSHIGARLAVRAAITSLRSNLSAENPDTAIIRRAFEEAHQAIQQRAIHDANPSRHYASTLAVAVVSDAHIAGGIIGDSSIAIHTQTGSAKRSALAPFVSGRPTSHGTLSVSEDYWNEALAIRACRYPAVKSIVVNSDGGNSLFTGTPDVASTLELNPEVLDAMPDLIAADGPRGLVLHLATYLANFSATNFDDRTILVATRPDRPLSIPG